MQEIVRSPKTAPFINPNQTSPTSQAFHLLRSYTSSLVQHLTLFDHGAAGHGGRLLRESPGLCPAPADLRVVLVVRVFLLPQVREVLRCQVRGGAPFSRCLLPLQEAALQEQGYFHVQVCASFRLCLVFFFSGALTVEFGRLAEGTRRSAARTAGRSRLRWTRGGRRTTACPSRRLRAPPRRRAMTTTFGPAPLPPARPSLVSSPASV